MQNWTIPRDREQIHDCPGLGRGHAWEWPLMGTGSSFWGRWKYFGVRYKWRGQNVVKALKQHIFKNTCNAKGLALFHSAFPLSKEAPSVSLNIRKRELRWYGNIFKAQNKILRRAQRTRHYPQRGCFWGNAITRTEVREILFGGSIRFKLRNQKLVVRPGRCWLGCRPWWRGIPDSTFGAEM